VRAVDFMIAKQYAITPTEFATAILDSEQYSHSASIMITLDRARAQISFDKLARLVAEQLTRMTIVELVGEAASLYGRTAFGWSVAGLVKRHGSLLGLDLKSCDQDFIEGLLELVETSLSCDD
jgi:hypothetical protein